MVAPSETLFCPACGSGLTHWGDPSDTEHGLDCDHCEITWHEAYQGRLFRCNCFSDTDYRVELVDASDNLPW